MPTQRLMHASARRALVLLLLAISALAVINAACSSEPDGAADDETGADAVVPAAGATDAAIGGTDERPREGRVINRFELGEGMCFNDYLETDPDSTDTAEVTTRINCDRLHDGEVFAEHTHPADGSVAFPGTTELQRWGVERCYGAFEAFVGEVYELSPLELGVILPDESSWTAGLYRTVHCYVQAPGDQQLEGSMRGSGS